MLRRELWGCLGRVLGCSSRKLEVEERYKPDITIEEYRDVFRKMEVWKKKLREESEGSGGIMIGGSGGNLRVAYGRTA